MMQFILKALNMYLLWIIFESSKIYLLYWGRKALIFSSYNIIGIEFPFDLPTDGKMRCFSQRWDKFLV